MRILVVSRIYTHPIDKGSSQAILAQTEALIKLGNEVHFLYIDEKHPRKNKEQYDTALRKTKEYWGAHFHYYRKPALEKYWNVFKKKIIHPIYCNPDDYYPIGVHKFVNKLNHYYKFDVCIVNYFELSKLLLKINIPKRALHTHDSFIYRDIVTESKNVRALTPNNEAKVLQRAPYIFALQDDDAVLFHRLSPLSKIYTIYTTIEYHIQPIIGNHNILFLSANEKFNMNGIIWFIEKVFPNIKNKYYDAKLLIGGSICNSIPEKYLKDGVELKGYVADVNSFYMSGDVAINPVSQGTGLKIKTIEALSYDKVTIVHPHSKEGLYKKEDLPLYVSDDSQDWFRFIDDVWSCQDTILIKKMQNRKYIEMMNMYVMNEYKRFLNE